MVTIELKFDIGDEVWPVKRFPPWTNAVAPGPATVVQFAVHSEERGKGTARYTVTPKGAANPSSEEFSEHALFATREEALKECDTRYAQGTLESLEKSNESEAEKDDDNNEAPF
jgi:hypothetical protein